MVHQFLLLIKLSLILEDYNYQSAIYDTSANRTAIIFTDTSANPNLGKAVVYQTQAQSTNLTAENYIGIAAESISDGATGKVTIFGGTNSGQTGLTTTQTYYVQNDGSLIHLQVIHL